MGKVHLLDKKVYELIAAGEVIERPSSIIKELVENSIDSMASSITIEIKQGGISYMRISDNGSGIMRDDVRTAFLRHATSKIKDESDLNNITTLGFRGEALASVAAVSKVDVLTKTENDFLGTHYKIEGTEEVLFEECGCPDGTTIIVRDLFYNVPARLKFLKRDVAEGNDIARIVEKIALSHSEISIKFIRDNKKVLFTPGDNSLSSAIYSVFGRQFALSLIPVDYKLNNIAVTGYTVKPVFGMKTRKYQTFFVNKRFVRSFTCIQALEEAYRNCIMEGKFPACVLFIDINPGYVDVNVHPQKMDVKFSDEKAVYEAVYFAVKNAVLSDNKPREIEIKKPTPNYSLPEYSGTPFEQTKLSSLPESKPDYQNLPSQNAYGNNFYNSFKAYNNANQNKFEHISSEDYRKKYADNTKNNFFNETKVPEKKKLAEEVRNIPEKSDVSEINSSVTADKPFIEGAYNPDNDMFPDEIKKAAGFISQIQNTSETNAYNNISEIEGEYKYINENSFVPRQNADEALKKEDHKDTKEIHFRIVGEIFKTYIVVEIEDGIVFIDKHAAHERMNFEKFRSGEVALRCQMLLEKKEIRLSYDEYDAVCQNDEIIKKLAFDIEPLDSPIVRINGIPSVLDFCDAGDIAAELAKNLNENKCNPMPEILDDMLHTIACKASVRANDNNSIEELEVIVKRVFTDDKIKYCPHGRPVMFKITKREIEKQFKRIV